MDAFSTSEERNLMIFACSKINKLYDLLICNPLWLLLKTISPIYCYTNFKDAVFHYFQMCIIDDRREKLDQFFALNEHITRAEKDYYSVGFYEIIYCAENLLQKVSDKAIIEQLFDVIYKSKDLLHTIRFSGMLMLSSDEVAKYEDFEECLNVFKTIIEEHALHKELTLILNER